MKSLFLSFLLLLTIHVDARYKAPEYTRYVAEIRECFIKQMKEEFGLSCSGTSGRMRNDVEEMGFDFSISNRVTLEEARAYIVFVTEKLVNMINSHQKIRPFLREYPFSHNRARVNISFNNLLGDSQSDGSPSYVLSGSSITYRARDAFKDRYVELYEEPYEEAARIVKSSYSRLPVHETTLLESAIDDIFYMYATEMAEDYGLYVWGIGCKKSDRLEEIGARFTVFYPVTKEQARALQVTATEKLLELVNTHEILKSYPLTSDRIKMRLNFRNTKYTRYRDGSIESVTLDSDSLTYLQMPLYKDGDPLSKLNEPIINLGTESYEEAQRLAGEKVLTFNMKPSPRELP